MATESYTRITANRIFDALRMQVDFNTVDKVLTRSNGFCHRLIKDMSLFTKLRNQADKINDILNLNQDIIVELIFKLQASLAGEETGGNGETQKEKDLNSLREYSEKVINALEEILEKITIQETKYMQAGREALEQWKRKQYQNAEILTDALIGSGEKLDERFTQRLGQHLFFEICNEKGFDPEKQIFYAIEQVLGSADQKIGPKVKQIALDMSKVKSQLLQPFHHIAENTANEQAIISELYQRVRALSSATRDYIMQEEGNKDDLKLLANELQDIAAEKAS